MLLDLSLPALTCVACRTKVRLKIALKAEFLSHFFVFHLVDHLSLSMTGTLNCELFSNAFLFHNPDYCYLFLHCHERGKKSIDFRRKQTSQSLRPAVSQTEGKRALMKKKRKKSSLKSSSLQEGWTCGLNLTRKGKEMNTGKSLVLERSAHYFDESFKSLTPFPRKLRAKVYLH